MKYLLDTCVVSELVKKSPNKNVVNWISKLPEEFLFLSSFTFAELHKGIEKLPNSKKKTELHDWVSIELMKRFEGRILDFNLEIATNWGSVMAESETNGNVLPLMDSLIAVTGITYNLIVVTQNTKDMKNSGATLLNPWKEK